MSPASLRLWATAYVTGIDTSLLSDGAIHGIYTRRQRSERKARSVDRLTARVVWGPGRWARLAIAGPHGVLR